MCEPVSCGYRKYLCLGENKSKRKYIHFLIDHIIYVTEVLCRKIIKIQTHKANKRICDFEAAVIQLPGGLPPALGAVCYSRLIPHFCAHRALCPWPSHRPSHLQPLPMTYQRLALTSRSFPALNVSVHTVGRGRWRSHTHRFTKRLPPAGHCARPRAGRLDEDRVARSVPGLAQTAAAFQSSSFWGPGAGGGCIFPSKDH